LTESTAGHEELLSILARIEATKASLVNALDSADPASFEHRDGEGDSLQMLTQRAIDEVNFYYGKLVARALNLPQPPGLTRADCGSISEGLAALQAAHRAFTNLLHDLVPSDLEKVAADPEHGSYTLRQVLELASAQYALKAQQVRELAAAPSGQPGT
jgi:hypothetical protein